MDDHPREQRSNRQDIPNQHHRLVLIPADNVPMVWPMVSDWVQSAADGSRYFTADEVYQKALTKHAQVWIVWGENIADAVVVTQLEPTPKGKFCHIWICVGRGMESWHGLIATIEEWARREGCTFMRHEARPGWSRILKQHGYEMPHVILEKEL